MSHLPASAAEYLQRTDSAVRHLFEGIASYERVLAPLTDAVFVTGLPPGPERDKQIAEWQTSHAEEIQAAARAVERFSAESFALDTLCGAVLAVAEKALELYSAERPMMSDLPVPVKPWQTRFCVGRPVLGLPLGLVVHAARNQHAHHEEIPREPGRSVFQWLASGARLGEPVERWDPAFDASRRVSLAGNVTALIGWRSYAAYAEDMRTMLLGEPGGLATARS